MTNQLTLTDQQFTGTTPTDQKLRLLVQDIQKAESAINALLNAVATLQDAPAAATSEVLADPALTAGFTVKGLTSGQVLQALTATSAAFKQLTLSQLAGIAVSGPSNGQLLTFVDGEWVNANPPAVSAAAGVNIGTGADVYAGLSSGKLAFKSISSDSSITITVTADTIELSAAASVGGLSFAQVSTLTSIRL